MQPASLRGLFLIDFLFCADAADGAAKPDADVEGHCAASCRSTADAYTSDESHFPLTECKSEVQDSSKNEEAYL